eukprot:CAMPEP_0176341862 /NCGR_PEP_ID=MMETSP0126-20121128/2712_1 /TAXON_ID=141414 ORGANISM="Strombidinopsis acuminatum, Strain SPMC142" /NCGR_SAMPLE_ID=MMETSP0126 /ASSEMBLY_ACC=CAM_ASM_000229 /LENGTH=53 /DNA_ID=CAMNT_0017686923 /DNA_START=782 /DNA_END=943 /DNA_ORIENTATION=+
MLFSTTENGEELDEDHNSDENDDENGILENESMWPLEDDLNGDVDQYKDDEIV